VLIVARIERDPQNRDAIDDFSLPRPQPVSVLDLAAPRVRNAGHDFDVEPFLHELARQRQAANRARLRIEPLSEERYAHASGTLARLVSVGARLGGPRSLSERRLAGEVSMRWLKVFGLAGVLALSTNACGGDDDSS